MKFRTKKSIEKKANNLERLSVLPGNMMQWAGLWEAAQRVLIEHREDHYRPTGSVDDENKYLNSMPPKMYVLHLCCQSLDAALNAKKKYIPKDGSAPKAKVRAGGKTELKLIHGVPTRIPAQRSLTPNTP